MTWLVWTLPLACLLLCGLLILELARDALIGPSDIEADDDDEPFAFVDAAPPFRINHVGPSGQHDAYPITPALRNMWTEFLEKSWEMPAREPGATR